MINSRMATEHFLDLKEREAPSSTDYDSRAPSMTPVIPNFGAARRASR